MILFLAGFPVSHAAIYCLMQCLMDQSVYQSPYCHVSSKIYLGDTVMWPELPMNLAFLYVDSHLAASLS